MKNKKILKLLNKLKDPRDSPPEVSKIEETKISDPNQGEMVDSSPKVKGALAQPVDEPTKGQKKFHSELYGQRFKADIIFRYELKTLEK